MWVVKLGGSLNNDPLLPEWLELLAQLGGGRVTIVCGGGGFADEVRRSQARWLFDDLPAHNMALLAMAQSAYLAQGINGRLRLASSTAQIRQVLHGGHTALWLPLNILREAPGPDVNWDVTADSLAFELARQLNAERLVLVKSCAIDRRASLAELGRDGILDQRFATWAANSEMPLDFVERTELERVRAMLLGTLDTMAP